MKFLASSTYLGCGDLGVLVPFSQGTIFNSNLNILSLTANFISIYDISPG